MNKITIWHKDGDEIEDTPKFGRGIDTNFIMGLGKLRKRYSYCLI